MKTGTKSMRISLGTGCSSSSAETLDEGYGPTDVADLAAFCPIRTTADLKDMSAWSIEDILDRQARMFDHAASLWPIA